MRRRALKLLSAAAAATAEARSRAEPPDRPPLDAAAAAALGLCPLLSVFFVTGAHLCRVGVCPPPDVYLGGI